MLLIVYAAKPIAITMIMMTNATMIHVSVDNPPIVPVGEDEGDADDDEPGLPT